MISKGLATRLQKFQNRAGGVILRAVSSKDLLEELGWSDLKTRKAKIKATQMFEISSFFMDFFQTGFPPFLPFSERAQLKSPAIIISLGQNFQADFRVL